MMIATILLIINFVLYVIDKPLLFSFVNFWWIYPVEIVLSIMFVVIIKLIVVLIVERYS